MKKLKIIAFTVGILALVAAWFCDHSYLQSKILESQKIIDEKERAERENMALLQATFLKCDLPIDNTNEQAVT